jgi:hypothetical protein
MAIDEDRLQALLAHPSESLQVELKTWIDPGTDEGAAKLIKSIFAIRNRNGGFLVMGFNNETKSADAYSFEDDVERVFHVDAIQGLVSRFASVPFDIEVAIRSKDEQRHPIIVIPEGTRVPTVAKRDLVAKGGKKLIAEGEIYFRTLRSNGTPSSARLQPGDAEELVEICFENREADIGRFLRRHLGGVDAGSISSLLEGEKKTPIRELAFKALAEGEARFSAEVKRRKLEATYSTVAGALTMHVALVVEPANPDAVPTQEFMNRVAAANPQFTGWPVWLDSRGFHEMADRAFVSDGAWQSLVVDLGGSWSQHFEFLLFDPRGNFHLRRVMQDDLTDKVDPGTALDVLLMLYRVAEVIAVGLSIVRALGWNEQARIGFAFRWTGLEERKLSGWVNALRWVGGRGTSHTNSAESYVEMPLDTPQSAIAPFVQAATLPLFVNFDGYEPSFNLVEKATQDLLERKI